MTGINIEIDNDEARLPEDYVDEEEERTNAEKDHQQKLAEKRRAIEDRLAQRQLERDTCDFDLDDLDD